MKTGMCGACGCKVFTVKLKGSPDQYELIVIECQRCGSPTKLSASKPTIQTQWGPGAEGILCPSGD